MAFVPNPRNPKHLRREAGTTIEQDMEVRSAKIEVCETCEFHVKPPAPGKPPDCKLLHGPGRRPCSYAFVNMLFGRRQHPDARCKWHAAGV